MNPDQWQLVRKLFLEVVDRDQAARTQILESLSTSDPDVAMELSSLLEANSSGPVSLDDVPCALGLGAESASAPDTIGRYRVLGVLGDGRAGIVYRVQQEHPAREVALKLLRSTLWSQDSERRFRNEIRALSLLRHQNIARVYDAGTLPEPGNAARPYFAMELVRGPNILQYVVLQKQASRTDIIRLFLQVCEGLVEAHRHGIIHRDLKPANILIDLESRSADQSGSPCVKVIDFGIARLLDSDESATMTGQVLGTLGYMSPEQLSGNSARADTRADVYAAGTILRELLEAHAKSAGHSERYSADLALILDTATRADRERRYGSIAAFAGDLRRYLGNRPIEARAPTVRYTVSKFVGRNKAFSAAIGLALIAVLSLLAMESFARQRAERAQRRAEMATRKAEELANVLLNAVAPSYEGKIGKSDERKRLVRAIHPQIEENAEMFPLDPATQSNYAKLLGLIGDVLQEEGNWDDALLRVKQVLTIRERLAEASPDDPRVLAALSIAMVRVGDLSERIRTDIPRDAWYQKALELDERLVARWPTDPNLLSNLAFSYERMAVRRLDRERFSEASELSDKQIDTSRRLLEVEPHSERALWGMCSAMSVGANILDNRRMFSESIRMQREAILLIRRLREQFPANKQPVKSLAALLCGLANRLLMADEGTSSERIALNEEAVALSRALAEADKSEVDPAWGYIRMLCNYARQLARAGRWDDAGAAFVQAEAAATRLTQECRGCREAAMSTFYVQYDQVQLALEVRDWEAVRTKARSLLPAARALYEQYPSLDSKAYVLHLLMCPLDSSPAECEEAVRLARELLNESPHHRITYTFRLAETLTYAGRLEEAAVVLEQLQSLIPPSETKLIEALDGERSMWAVKASVLPSKAAPKDSMKFPQK